MQPRREQRHASDQIPYQFFFWGERFCIHDRDFGCMPFTKRLKAVLAKADKAMLIADQHLADQTQFDLLKDVIEAFAFGSECRAKVLDPLVNLDCLF